MEVWGAQKNLESMTLESGNNSGESGMDDLNCIAFRALSMRLFTISKHMSQDV